MSDKAEICHVLGKMHLLEQIKASQTQPTSFFLFHSSQAKNPKSELEPVLSLQISGRHTSITWSTHTPRIVPHWSAWGFLILISWQPALQSRVRVLQMSETLKFRGSYSTKQLEGGEENQGDCEQRRLISVHCLLCILIKGLQWGSNFTQQFSWNRVPTWRLE